MTINKVDCTVAKFYAGKNVFITGVTGFVGAVLLEALLAPSLKIDKIYVLVRKRNGNDVKQRMDKLLAQKVFFYIGLELSWSTVNSSTPHK